MTSLLMSSPSISIRHLHISHSAPYLPPKIWHNLYFSFLFGITAVPRETEDNAYAKFWGQIRGIYGRCASGVFRIDFFDADIQIPET